MPTRTQTPKRPPAGRFGRPAGKPAHRPARGQRTTTSRRPAMPTVGRRPQKKSGAAKVAEQLGGLLPTKRGHKRGASGGPGKKGTAGLALLAGAAGLLMKNREKLTSKIRHRDSSVEPGGRQAATGASNSGPNPPVFPDQPAA